jgi:hypothetical protein
LHFSLGDNHASGHDKSEYSAFRAQDYYFFMISALFRPIVTRVSDLMLVFRCVPDKQAGRDCLVLADFTSKAAD